MGSAMNYSERPYENQMVSKVYTSIKIFNYDFTSDFFRQIHGLNGNLFYSIIFYLTLFNIYSLFCKTKKVL